MSGVEIIKIAPDQFDDRLIALAEILHACVDEGASVGFVWPFSMEESCAFWRGSVGPEVKNGNSILFTAVSGADVVWHRSTLLRNDA